MDLVKEQTSKISQNDDSWLPGIVKWYDLTRGYGFVIVDKTDVFIHVNELKKAGFIELKDNMRVEVKVKPVGLRYRASAIRLGE